MEVELCTNQEYRIEVSEMQKLKIMVMAGIAEINGQELLNDKWYNFSNIKVAIFTFTGAKLKIDGICELQYIALSSSVPKIFSYFDSLLKGAYLNKNILVLGNGRSTFCTILTNYFIRMHKTVRFTEIDPSKGNIFPGTLSTMIVDSLVDYEEHFKLNNPSCFYYGSTEIDNIELYDLQIGALIKLIEDAAGNEFHMILSPELSPENLNNLIKKLKVSDVIFIGNERLYNKMDLIAEKRFIECSGYIPVNTVASSINRYFNGIDNKYSTCSYIVKTNVKVVRIGEEYVAPDSALPLGATRKVGKTSTNQAELVNNSVLAISEATNEEDVATSIVSGFIVCVDDKKFRILCTQTRLPKALFLIQGNIKYIDF